MKVRLTLITEIIAPYRILVFQCAFNAANPEVELKVLFLAENDARLCANGLHLQETRSGSVTRYFRSWRFTQLGKYNLLHNRDVAGALQAFPGRKSFSGPVDTTTPSVVADSCILGEALLTYPFPLFWSRKHGCRQPRWKSHTCH